LQRATEPDLKLRLTLHRRCLRILELQPVQRAAGPVARSQSREAEEDWVAD